MNEEELKAKVATLEADKTALVAEITSDRSKNRQSIEAKDEELRIAKEALVASVAKNNASPEESKITEALEKLLSQKEGERATANKKAAFDKFVNDNKEYHPDNDIGGIKKAALEAQFNRFNQNGIIEVDAFSKLIGDANALLRGPDTSRQPNTQILSTPSPTNQPKSAPDNELTSKEIDLINSNGWTKEKYMELKAKMPDFIEGLIG